MHTAEMSIDFGKLLTFNLSELVSTLHIKIQISSQPTSKNILNFVSKSRLMSVLESHEFSGTSVFLSEKIVIGSFHSFARICSNLFFGLVLKAAAYQKLV